MGICESGLWWECVDRELDVLEGLACFNGKSILVTGASGLVCSPIVDMLIRYNETRGGSITIYVAGRWPEEMESRFGSYMQKKYLSYVEYDASRARNSFPPNIDYVVHGASNANPQLIAKEPVETMLSAFTGMYQLLEQIGRGSGARLLYISSSEVYGRISGNEPIGENEYSFIDILSPRNSYSVAKRAAETLCASYASEYGVDFVIARPGHIFGPTSSKYDDRVASSWTREAAKGLPIVMKSEGMQLRSWCHCLDCATALLTILLKGEKGTAYNISNPNSIATIADLAECIAAMGDVEIVKDLPSDSERMAFNPMSNSSLESSRLLGLGWKGVFGLEDGVSNTIAVLREIACDKGGR